jgi:hypothetical protein
LEVYFVLSLRVSILERYAFSFNVTQIAEPLTECLMGCLVRRADETYPRDCLWLLRLGTWANREKQSAKHKTKQFLALEFPNRKLKI